MLQVRGRSNRRLHTAPARPDLKRRAGEKGQTMNNLILPWFDSSKLRQRVIITEGWRRWQVSSCEAADYGRVLFSGSLTACKRFAGAHD